MIKRVLAFGFALATATSAFAAPIYVQTTPAGAAALPQLTGGTVIDFETTAAGTYPNLATSGVTFTADGNNVMWVDGAYIGQYNTFGRQSLHNNYDARSFNTLTIAFDSPVDAFGFFWGASDDQWTLNAYGAGNVLLESYALPITYASNAGDFVGLAVAGIEYATLVGVGSDFVFIDNFAYRGAVVPEPGTLVLLFCAGAAAGLRKRFSA